MAVRIKFDESYNAIRPTLVLANRSGVKLGAINATSVNVSDNFNSSFELEFDVYKYNNDGIARVLDDEDGKDTIWDKTVDFKLVWAREWDVWFEIYVQIDEDEDTVKHVSAVSLGEAELSQINLYNIEINTEDDIANDDYVPTVLYDEENPRASLLNRILEKAPHYSIGHVDNRIAGIQRSFSFDNDSIYDALQDIAEEIDCIFIIDSGSNDDGSIKRIINAYDLEAFCPTCGYRDTFVDVCPKCGGDVLNGYGDDTNIYVSVENLAENISYSTDTDSVKNCFKLEAGDDLMTATVINSNPNGSAYIWYISDAVRADMSDELVERLDEYDEAYDYYNTEYELNIPSYIISAYNEVIEKYSEYDDSLNTLSDPMVGYDDLVDAYYDTIDLYYLLNDSLMPNIDTSSTTAEIQAALLIPSNLSPVAVQDLSIISTSTASNAVLAVAKVIVDNRYSVNVNESSVSGNVWTGNFKVTNYSDEEDTCVSSTISVTINDDFETFLKQNIDKALNKVSVEDGTDVSSLFKIDQPQFNEELEKWSLTSLKLFNDACQICLDLLIEQGIADTKTWADKTPNMYDELYYPYYSKLLAIQNEILVREHEIEIVVGGFDAYGNRVYDGVQNFLDDERAFIHDELNFEKFIGTDLWLEFAAYRREDTYSNDNFISDGLNNKELVERAAEFIEDASKEIYKSATLQHSISATLKNLLVMEEFLPIINNFKVGNWIHIKVDDNIYRLRLLSYSIDFDDLDTLSIEFSDVKQYKDGVTDSESIMAQAKSMASSYGAVTRQAGKGNKTYSRVNDWVSDGLSMTHMKIVSAADNQNITWDSHGILCREYLPITDNYSDKQIKIINKGLYVTDDNWRTSKAGIGNFMFYNPRTGQEEEAYGVIADTLVGNLILSQDVGIYNTTGGVVIDEDGIEIISDMTGDSSTPMNLSIGKVYLNSEGEEQTDRAIYIDSDGNVVISGNVKINPSDEYDIETVNDLCNPDSMHQYVEQRVTDMSDLLNTQAATYYTELYGYSQDFLEYRDRMSQCISIDEDRGLVISGYNPATQDISKFETVIDNESIKFKSDDTIVAYVNHELLYIPNAAITTTLRLGKFFVFPRNDDGVSIIWVGDYIPRTINSRGELVLVEVPGAGELVGSSGESSSESENNSESGSITYTGRPSKQEMLAMLEEIENQEVEGGD